MFPGMALRYKLSVEQPDRDARWRPPESHDSQNNPSEWQRHSGSRSVHQTAHGSSCNRRSDDMIPAEVARSPERGGLCTVPHPTQIINTRVAMATAGIAVLGSGGIA